MTVTLQEAQARLPELAQKAKEGETVLIALGDDTSVTLTADAPTKRKRRLGSLDGLWQVPDDFDTMFQKEIEEMFYGADAT